MLNSFNHNTQGITFGGCRPLRRPFIGFPNPFCPPRADSHQGNLQDTHTGGRVRGSSINCWRGNHFHPRSEQTKGYALDLNKNGRYDRGQDAVLVFDMNRDGKYDQNDISNTNKMMKAASGDYDMNGDGHVSRSEKIQGAILRQRYNQMDRNRDGKLSTEEMKAGGGKAWVDSSQGGGIGKNELHSVDNIPSRFIGGTTQRIDYVDPYRDTNGTSNNQPWWPTSTRATGWIPG